MFAEWKSVYLWLVHRFLYLSPKRGKKADRACKRIIDTRVNKEVESQRDFLDWHPDAFICMTWASYSPSLNSPLSPKSFSTRIVENIGWGTYTKHLAWSLTRSRFLRKVRLSSLYVLIICSPFIPILDWSKEESAALPLWPILSCFWFY